jgi:hypothetical protein
VNTIFSQLLKLLLGGSSSQRYRKIETHHPASQTGTPTPKTFDPISKALKGGKELDSLPAFYWVLYNQAGQDTTSSLENLKSILSVSPADLWKIDTLCRSKTSMEWTFDWSTVGPEGLFPKDIADSDKVWIYGFSSFHPSGFFREKATIGLAGIKSGDEIPFLIIRLNDWVEGIREKAKQAIEERIVPAFALHFLKFYPLLKRLENAGRDAHGAVVKKITTLISQDRKVMEQGLVAPDPDTRRLSFEIAANSSKIELGDVKDAIFEEPVGMIKLLALRSFENRVSFPEDSSFIHSLIEDRFAPIQRVALDILCSRSLENNQEILKGKIFSEKSGIRQTARYYLKKTSVANPAELYRMALVERKEAVLLGAIRGIGEVGDKEDVDLLVSYLQGTSIKILRSTISSISSLNPDNMPEILLPFVSDLRPGVSREAAAAVKKRCMEIDLDRLNGIAHASKLSHVQKNIFRVLLAADHWTSLPYILEASGSEYPTIPELAKKGLERWLIESNRYFIQPSTGQKGKAKLYLSRYSKNIDQKTKEVLEFILR